MKEDKEDISAEVLCPPELLSESGVLQVAVKDIEASIGVQTGTSDQDKEMENTISTATELMAEHVNGSGPKRDASTSVTITRIPQCLNGGQQSALI